MSLNRRELLKRGALLAGATALPGLGSLGCAPLPLFTLGVASGDPGSRSVVLWTRLAPDPLTPGGGMAANPFNVMWEVATDPAMSQVIRSGWATALPELAHSIHVTVLGLPPDSWLWYRFTAGSQVSPVGRTRTFPDPGTQPGSMRFILACCQNYGDGFYSAYHNIAQEDVDFVVHAGDYIYERNFGSVRSISLPESVTLSDYRARYALYKLDPQLQAAHARFPFIHTWDDHEVVNDYAGVVDEDGNTGPAFLARRAAAYQANYEHLPLSSATVAAGFGSRLYRRFRFGDLAQILTLDTRSQRSPQPCPVPNQTFGPLCAAALDPAQTFLGFDQEAWLENRLESPPATWNVLAQSQMMSGLQLPSGAGSLEQLEAWAGYPRARQQVLDALVNGNARNPIVLAGDFHASFVSDLKPDSFDPNSPVVAAEFLGPAISSFPAVGLAGLLPFIDLTHGHLVYRDVSENGYVLFEMGPTGCSAEIRAVTSVLSATAGVTTLASFQIQEGVPGAVQV